MVTVDRGDGMQVRTMVEADVPAVATIEVASFSDAWPGSAFDELLRCDYARLRVAVSASGEVVGYCVLTRAADEGEIANICTAPAVRGTGVGGLLLDDALGAADAGGTESVYLEVRVSNAAARGLYESRGFAPAGRRRGYYQQPTEDALVLRRARPQPVPAPGA
ncbi:ribosomal protein S18-alanine N-acetyltransferase [Gemmatimonas sp.]|jgi:ribosomal-protein-alanine N-acetyltransferase|uniref:ribosomal protein S18-alanine N-acetyltransferase n=1 Tax=Gemmatimonas sp. TaxID=1962908 RepID=UPI0037BE4942